MGCAPVLKTTLGLLKGMVFLGGLAVLGVGIWVKVESSSVEKILAEAVPQLVLQVAQVANLCTTVGACLVLLAFLGCWGALRRSKGLLLLFFGLMLALFIAGMVGVAMALEFSTAADAFNPSWEEWALKTIKEYGMLRSPTAIWDVTMTELQCCGFHNYTDFIDSAFGFFNSHRKFPRYCCRGGAEYCTKSKVDKYKQGCLQKIQEFLKGKAMVVRGVCMGTGILQLAAMGFFLILYSDIGRSQ